MKQTKSFGLLFTLVIVMLFSAVFTVAAQDKTDKYISVHTEEELKTLEFKLKK